MNLPPPAPVLEMNKLSTRHLRMMNVLEETLREIARLFRPYVSIFTRSQYNLPPSSLSSSLSPSPYIPYLVTAKNRNLPSDNLAQLVSQILNFQDPSYYIPLYISN